MFFEQNQLEMWIGSPRFWRKLKIEKPAALVEHYTARATVSLKVLEAHLSRHDWFVGDAYSVADIAVFAYTHLAPEAGHDLAAFPKLGAWLQRFRQQPGWFPLE